MHPLKPLDNTLISSSANFIKEHKYKIIAAIAAIALVALAFTPPGAMLAAVIVTGIAGSLIVKGGAIVIGAAIIGIAFLFNRKSSTEKVENNSEKEKAHKELQEKNDAKYQTAVAALAKSKKEALEGQKEAERIVAEWEAEKFAKEVHSLFQGDHDSALLAERFKTERMGVMEPTPLPFTDKDLEIGFEDDYEEKVANPPNIVVIHSPVRPVPAASSLVVKSTNKIVLQNSSTPPVAKNKAEAYEEFRAALMLKAQKEAMNRKPEKIKGYDPKVNIEERFTHLTTPPKPPRVTPNSSS